MSLLLSESNDKEKEKKQQQNILKGEINQIKKKVTYGQNQKKQGVVIQKKNEALQISDSLSGSIEIESQRESNEDSDESENRHLQQDDAGNLLDYFRDKADYYKTKFRGCAEKVQELKKKIRKLRKKIGYQCKQKKNKRNKRKVNNYQNDI